MNPGRAAHLLLLLAIGLLDQTTATAHPLAPSLLELRAEAAGGFAVVWKTPLRMAVGMQLDPVLPERCQATTEAESRAEGTAFVMRWRVDCGDAGLTGARIGVTGMIPRGPGAVVRVERASGAIVQGYVTAGQPFLSIPEVPSRADVLRNYLRIGAEHLFFGLDHVLFVLGLLLLVHSRRALLLTVTAFTLGHSVTLSLAALELLEVPSRWVEVAIAGTLVALAFELVPRAGPARSSALFGQRPWRMAFTFGLLHGLGFAGALNEVGLPHSEIPLALLSFNLGIEVGQLALVAAALLAALAARPVVAALPPRLPLLRVAAYGIGGMAAYWMIERVSAVAS